MPVVGLRKDLAEEVRDIREGINLGHKQAVHKTIFHELLNSDLPDDQKTDARLGDEAQLVVAAGVITTSWALSVASFYLSNDADTAAKLRRELADAGFGPGPASGAGGPRGAGGDRGDTAAPVADWHVLEKLPYLNGCVHEAIRFSHGVVTRDPRLAPDAALRYGDFVIPPNTPVSMTTVDVLMNDDVFAEPTRFRPERWIEGGPALERYFVPFGKGSRQCLGIK
jgi:cytochrome P450